MRTTYFPARPRFIYTISTIQKQNLQSRKKRKHREKTYKVNVEVEAEHIGVFIGVTPDSDREFSYIGQLVRTSYASGLAYL